jgi:hypothetical protein
MVERRLEDAKVHVRFSDEAELVYSRPPGIMRNGRALCCKHSDFVEVGSTPTVPKAIGYIDQ